MRRRIWWRILRIGILLVLLGITAMLFLAHLQKKLIFYPNYPTREIVETPGDYGLLFDDVHFAACDGITLSAWYVPADEPHATVLFCHGNAGNISHRIEDIRIFNRLKLNTFIFDYRGYGKSEGRTSEQGTYRDVEAALLYLIEERGIPESEIIVVGRSLGGAIAAWIAQDRKVKALVIESAFTSIPDIGAELYPFLPVRRFATYRYATVEYLQGVRCPVLIVHSVDDEMISFRHAERLFQAAGEPKELLRLRGTHNEGIYESAAGYEEGLKRFLSGLSR